MQNIWVQGQNNKLKCQQTWNILKSCIKSKTYCINETHKYLQNRLDPSLSRSLCTFICNPKMLFQQLINNWQTKVKWITFLWILQKYKHSCFQDHHHTYNNNNFNKMFSYHFQFLFWFLWELLFLLQKRGNKKNKIH